VLANDFQPVPAKSAQQGVLPWKMMTRHHSMVHWTLGILRDLQAFFWLRVFPAPRQNPRPPQRQYRLLQLSRIQK